MLIGGAALDRDAALQVRPAGAEPWGRPGFECPVALFGESRSETGPPATEGGLSCLRTTGVIDEQAFDGGS